MTPTHCFPPPGQLSSGGGSPSQSSSSQQLAGLLQVGEQRLQLNQDQDQQTLNFFRDNDVLLQIDKDVRRLCPDLTFFQQVRDLSQTQIKIKMQATPHPARHVVEQPGSEKLHARVTQVNIRLFACFVKLSPGQAGVTDSGEERSGTKHSG